MSGPRVVLDTNVLISHALLPNSVPAQAVRKALHTGIILVSMETLSELADVLARPKFDPYVSITDRQQFLLTLGRVAERVTTTRKVQACRDPKDDKFLELAVNGQADILVTGDSNLLVL